jgi:hypothetical protein
VLARAGRWDENLGQNTIGLRYIAVCDNSDIEQDAWTVQLNTTTLVELRKYDGPEQGRRQAVGSEKRREKVDSYRMRSEGSIYMK